MKCNPEIGEEFQLEAKVLQAQQSLVVERTRSMIALIVLVSGTIALLASMIIGLFTQEYGPLTMLWSIVAAPMGWIVGYYFHFAKRLKPENEQND